MPHAPHAHLHTHVPVLVRTGIDPPRRRTARRLAAAPHARLHRIFSKQRQGLKTRRMVCAHSPSRRPPPPPSLAVPPCSPLPAGVLAAGVGVRGVKISIFFAVLPFFGPETPLIPYFPRTEIGKNQKNHDSGTGHVFSFRWEFGGRRQGPEAPCFSRQTRGQPRRAERGCWVGFFSYLFHKYVVLVPCPEHSSALSILYI